MANGQLFGAAFPQTIEDVSRRARQRILERQRQQREVTRRELLAGATSPAERSGLAIGAALGGGAAGALFGDILAERELAEDPDVLAARESLALAEQLQGLTQGPEALEVGTPEFFTQAAQIASEAGRPAAALQLGLLGAEARREQEKRERALGLQKAEQRRAEFNLLPADAKLITAAEDPTVVRQIRPDLTDEQAEVIQQQLRDTVETRRLKNVAELAKIKPARVTKPTKVDVNQTGALLEDVGLGQEAFTRWFGLRDDPDKFGQFVVTMTDQVIAEQDKAAREGRRLSRREILQEIRADLAEQGGLTEEDGEITAIDSVILNRVLADRLAGQPVDTPPPEEPAPRRRPGIIDL